MVDKNCINYDFQVRNQKAKQIVQTSMAKFETVYIEPNMHNKKGTKACGKYDTKV